MTGLKIRVYPDPILRAKSKEVAGVGDEEKSLLSDMAETMRARSGIGLAAPQVGVTKRMFVIDAGDGLFKMTNPKITAKKGLVASEEGCLSLPERLVEVQRAGEVTVSYLDENNCRTVKTLSGLAAKAAQHEIDHLDGKLIIDYLPWLKRIFSKKGETTCLQ